MGRGVSAKDAEEARCACHDEPMWWHRDWRCVRGGWWSCRHAFVRTRNRIANDRRYWHKKDGGYIKSRKRRLAEQRTRIVAKLKELEQHDS
jgi:hypothetical protein